MAKEFKAIAMRCTKEQWESVREKIKENDGNLIGISSWSLYPWLINNYMGIPLDFANLRTPNLGNRAIYDTFDEKILFESCGWEYEEESPEEFYEKLTDKLASMKFDKSEAVIDLKGRIGIILVIEPNDPKPYFVQFANIKPVIPCLETELKRVKLAAVPEEDYSPDTIYHVGGSGDTSFERAGTVYGINHELESDKLTDAELGPEDPKRLPEPKNCEFKKGDELIFLWDRNLYNGEYIKSLHGQKVSFIKYADTLRHANIDCIINNQPRQAVVKLESLHPIVSKEKRAQGQYQLYASNKAFIAVDNGGQVAFEIVYIECDYNPSMLGLVLILDSNGIRRSVPFNSLYYFAIH